MIKLINKIRKLIVLTTLILFLVIGYNAIMYTDMSDFLNSVTNHSEYIYWSISLGLGLFIIILFKFIDKFSIKKKRILKYSLILFLVLLQLIMLVDLNFVQVTDAYLVNDQARALAFGLDKTLDYKSTVYFVAYSNNNFCVLLTILLTKLFSVFNLANYNNYLVLFNIFLIDLSIFLTYRIAKEVKNEDFALKTLIVSILNPLNYLFIHWTYTCTYSLPFTIGCIYLFILIQKQKEINYKFVIFSIFLGLVSIIGYLLRPIIIIPLIAIFIMLFIYTIEKKKEVKLFITKNFKRLIITIGLVLFVTFFCYNQIVNSIDKFATDSSKNFPIAHWIMMGLHGTGVVTESDNNFTLSYKTTEEKKAANIREIKNTLKEYEYSGLINHFIIKLPVTWDDGISSYDFRAGYINNSSSLYQFIYGEKNDLIVIYCQAFRILTIFLVIISLLNQLKKNDYRFLFTLTLYGAILFYLIWEAKNAYSIPFIPFMIILASDSLDLIARSKHKIKIDKVIKYKKIGILCITLTIISFISLENGFTKEISQWHDYQIKMQLDYNEWVSDISKNDKEIKQEFYADRKFNYISLGVGKIIDNDTEYDIKIYTDDKELASFTINYQDIENNVLKLQVESGNITSEQKYLIVIKPVNKGNIDSIKWGYRFSKATDQYKGKLFVDDEEISSDLVLGVYYQYEGTYISKVKYYLLLAIVVLFEIFIIKFLNKEN